MRAQAAFLPSRARTRSIWGPRMLRIPAREGVTRRLKYLVRMSSAMRARDGYVAVREDKGERVVFPRMWCGRMRLGAEFLPISSIYCVLV